jgi:hypothetical protein
MKRAVAVATATMLLSIAAVADAGTNPQYPTVFTKFKYKGGESFSGKIDSTKGGCVGGRKVILFRKHDGNSDKVGSDHTEDSGKFKIELSGGPPKDGKYYAKVKQSKLGNGAICLERESGSVKVTTS